MICVTVRGFCLFVHGGALCQSPRCYQSGDLSSPPQRRPGAAGWSSGAIQPTGRGKCLTGSSAAGPSLSSRCQICPSRCGKQLDAEWTVFGTRVAYHGVAPDGTDKLVLECHDGRRIECVLMAEESRRTVCLSTQVGCGMGCVFCASGLKGVERNLSADEILEQVLHLRNLLAAGGDGHACCRHGNGREPGKSRQPDRCA